MPRLIACSVCARHVRATEPRCPFCGHGPLRCEAPLTTRWVLGASLLGLTLAGGTLVGCDKGGAADKGDAAKRPAEERSDDGSKLDPKPDPDGDDEGQSDGDADAVVDEESERVPQKTIYGGPRMMTAGPPEELEPTLDAPDGPDQVEPPPPREKRPMKYGGPSRRDDEPKPLEEL